MKSQTAARSDADDLDLESAARIACHQIRRADDALNRHTFTLLMAEIKRSTLFGKLNSVGYKAIEGATIFCKMRGNPYVETQHWLHQ